MTHYPRHLSVSAIECYSQCPAAFERRYIHGVLDPPSPAMAFGRAMAKALEAEHRGQDGDVAWVRAYTADVLVHPNAPRIEHGLRLLAAYRAYGVGQGEPEQMFREYLPDREAIPVPILGFMDLLTVTDVLEFKTSRARWDQGRADASLQAVVYAWAAHRLTGRKPQAVRFIVLNTREQATNLLTELVTYPACGELHLFELRAAAVWRAIRDGAYPPTCRRADCLACVEAGVAVPRQNGGGGLELVGT